MTRKLMPCCGALDMGDSWHGGRPFQCRCEHEAWRVAMRLDDGAAKGDHDAVEYSGTIRNTLWDGPLSAVLGDEGRSRVRSTDG